MNYLFIVLGIIVVILLYLIYTFLFPSKSQVATKNYLANGVANVSFEKLENPSSPKYSVEVWVYANSLSDNLSNFSDNTGGNMAEGLIFAITNKIYLNIFKDSTLAFYNHSYSTLPTVVAPNFPLQRWVYVVISVDNTLVDLYLDGKLIRSAKMRAGYTPVVPTIDSSFTFGKGDIYIAGMNRTATTTDSNTVFQNYMKGNAGLKVPGYTVSLDFLKNSAVAKNIPIM
jgi:hypothetical protein